MTPTDAKKREAIDAAQAAGFKVETGPKVKGPEKIAPPPVGEAAEQVPGPRPTASHGTVTPVAEARPGTAPAQEGSEFTLWGTVDARVFPESQGTYSVEFLKDSRRLCIETTKSPIWDSIRLQDKAAVTLAEALGDDARAPDFMRKRVREAFAAFAERLKTDRKVQQALTSEPVRRVMDGTTSVDIYPSAATTYEIAITGRNLTVPVKEMARTDPGFINAAWLNLFPTKPLDATRKDWIQIREFWMSDDLAVIREVETLTEAEIVIDRLRAELESVSLVESPDLVNDDNRAWKDPGTGEVWVPARRITRFLDETVKKPGWSSMLSKEVRAAGGMKTATRTKKMGNPPLETRCWVFDGGFAVFRDARDEPIPVSEYVRNCGGETGDL